MFNSYKRPGIGAVLALTMLLASVPFTSSVEAAVVFAASCSRAAVSTAIAAAAEGDTVSLPPCSATTWTSGIEVDKAINITGAGIDITRIALAGGRFISFSGTSAENKVAQLGNLTLSGSAPDGEGFIEIDATYRFRFHHMKIGDVGNRAITVIGSSGLIDHMQFTTFDGYNAIQILGAEFTPTGRWQQPMNFGSPDQVYVEDSTFTATQCVTSLGIFDGFNGSRLVFRHNVVKNWSGYVHGFDSSSESALQWEIYDNMFDMLATDCAIPRMLFVRGGTGYIYNNTMHLTDPFFRFTPKFVELFYYRSIQAQQGTICNGFTDIDENRPNMPGGQKGYLCFQQPGTGGPGLHTSIPIYEYNNVGTGNMPVDLDLQSTSLHVQEGRDFFNDTQKPLYEAYTYPHPLTAGPAAAPSAPSNLRIIPNVSP